MKLFSEYICTVIHGRINKYYEEYIASNIVSIEQTKIDSVHYAPSQTVFG